MLQSSNKIVYTDLIIKLILKSKFLIETKLILKNIRLGIYFDEQWNRIKLIKES